MKRLHFMKDYYINSINKGKCKDNTIQECLFRLKTFQEKEKFLKFADNQK
ncbi:hypothetical protein WKH56_10310 [Priestia sp. SB1]|uniref:Uncharacterized protein n=1 Tax=Priestia aryabhattai TaxID=412384 RepID=A0AAX6NDS0_PRIAR|nr:hypothetical protein [Priestia aryabhattai]MDU9693655.1 hypothetical protein [Priestia aryabhattai]